LPRSETKAFLTTLKGLIGGEVERAETFQRIAIRTFRESPKWDEDAFVRGYK
jgi:hypothetical protein